MTVHNEGISSGAVYGAHFCPKNQARIIGTAFITTWKIDAVMLPINRREVDVLFVELRLESVTTAEFGFEDELFHLRSLSRILEDTGQVLP